MKKTLLALLLLFPLVALAADYEIVATITITNAPLTNGQTFTNSADVRTWTNAVFDSSKQVLTNATISGAAHNMQVHLAAHPFSGLAIHDFTTNSISLRTVLNGPSPALSLSPGWGTVSFTTNPVGVLTSVRIPVSGEPSAAVRTNVASALAAALMSTDNTNELKFSHAQTVSDISTNQIPLAGVTNAGTAAYSNTTAFVAAPTNSPSDGQVVSRSGDKNKWIALSAQTEATHATNADFVSGTLTNSISGNAATATTAGTATNAINSTNFFGTIFGTNYSFATLTTPNSQGTNWILDFKTATYQKILLTNNVYVQYATNSPGAMSLDLLPNGSDRTLSVPTNWVLLSTNSWSLNTALNPGVWQQTITNATAGAGPRRFWLSLVSDDSTGNQTNVVAIGRLSPP